MEVSLYVDMQRSPLLLILLKYGRGSPHILSHVFPQKRSGAVTLHSL